MNIYDWYTLDPRGDAAADADPEWLLTFRREHTCSECGRRHLAHTRFPVNMVLVEQPQNAPLVSTSLVTTCLMRQDLYAVLRGHMSSFQIGRVSGHPAGSYDDFITYTPDRIFAIRGAPSSVIGFCPSCGQLRYHPQPFGKGYVLSSSLIPDVFVYMPNTQCLLVHKRILGMIPETIRRQLRVKGIPVRQEPMDGLTEFPELRP